MLTDENVDRADRGLRPGHRRHGHVRDALHAQRCGRARAAIPVVHASVFRFEGQLTVVRAVRGPVLPLPLPDAAAARARARLLGRGRARRRARRDGPAPGDRGDQAVARHRRPAGRPAAHLGRARRHVQRGQAAARPDVPGMRRRGRRARQARRRTPRSPRRRRDEGPHPARPANAGQTGRRKSRRPAPRSARSSRTWSTRYPEMGDQLLTADGGLASLRQRLPQRPGRALPAAARDAGRRPRRADHPAGNGRRSAWTGSSLDATRRSSTRSAIRRSSRSRASARTRTFGSTSSSRA